MYFIPFITEQIFKIYFILYFYEIASLVLVGIIILFYSNKILS